jgi:peptidoglycan/LPS O-acetylase OafA/YrhL
MPVIRPEQTGKMTQGTHHTTLSYVPGLDGIRAIAVILVVALHAKVPALSGGFVGVDMFFVLSGFLISTLLLHEIDSTGTVSFRSFWRRRLVRLFPAMAAMAAVFLCVARWLPLPPKAPTLEALVSVLYLADYARAFTTFLDYLAHSWSLAVEAKFYLFWPLILTVGARRLSPVALERAIGFLAVAAVAWRALNAHMLPLDVVYFRFDTSLSGLLIGSAVAAALRAGFRPILPASAGLLPLALLPLLSRPLADPGMLVFAPVLFQLAAALLILLVVQGNCSVSRILTCRPAVWLGGLSYGVYLWHYPIMLAMRREEWHWASTLLIGGCASIALAWVSFHTIERWVRRYRGGPAEAKSPATLTAGAA